MLRCLQCAGEPVPADLPVEVVPKPRLALGLQPVRTVAEDWKRKAAGKD